MSLSNFKSISAIPSVHGEKFCVGEYKVCEYLRVWDNRNQIMGQNLGEARECGTLSIPTAN